MEINPYQYFDDIVCINLDHRTDKKNISQKIFNLLGINSRFHTVKKHPKGGIYGCFESHIQVIQQAYENKLNNIMIFEDDIKVTPSYSQLQVKECVDFMQNNKEWDIFYLGYFACNTSRGSVKDFISSKFINNHIIEFRPFATHAYCLSRKGMRKVLDTYKNYIGKIHLDHYYVKIKLDSYCTVPLLFDQYLCLGTDNESFDSFEAFVRKFQCNADLYHLFYRPTLIKYKYNKHYSQYVMHVIILVLMMSITIGIVKLRSKN